MIKLNGSEEATKTAFERLESDGRRALQDSWAQDRLASAIDLKRGLGGSLIESLFAQEALRTLKRKADEFSGRRDKLQAAQYEALASLKTSIAARSEGLPDFSPTVPHHVGGSIAQSRALLEKQTQHLEAIADINERQYEMISSLVTLQDSLVKEALENSRIQRVVLYFAAIGTLFALISAFK